jgi:hypothetical protein
MLVDVQYKAWVCSRLIAGIAGFNPAENMEVRLLLSVVCLAASAKN